MAFASLSDFFAMGGHALYVWTAYGLGAAVILFNIVSPLQFKKRLITDQKRRERREQS